MINSYVQEFNISGFRRVTHMVSVGVGHVRAVWVAVTGLDCSLAMGWTVGGLRGSGVWAVRMKACCCCGWAARVMRLHYLGLPKPGGHSARSDVVGPAENVGLTETGWACKGCWAMKNGPFGGTVELYFEEQKHSKCLLPGIQDLARRLAYDFSCWKKSVLDIVAIAMLRFSLSMLCDAGIIFVMVSDSFKRLQTPPHGGRNHTSNNSSHKLGEIMSHRIHMRTRESLVSCRGSTVEVAVDQEGGIFTCLVTCNGIGFINWWFGSVGVSTAMSYGIGEKRQQIKKHEEESILQLKEQKRKEHQTTDKAQQRIANGVLSRLSNIEVAFKKGCLSLILKISRLRVVGGKEKRERTLLIKENNKEAKKVEDDKEIAELKQLMKIIPDEEEVAIDAIPLAVKSPIKCLKTHSLSSSCRISKITSILHKSTRPVEDLDMFLWGDLKTMFEPHVEDAVWRNQQGYKVLDWKLYDSCGVHSLRMQHMQIYMLVEKKYPLAPLTLSMMLEKKLNIDYESEMAYQLLKFIIKQLKK
ncbi:hypothetical protein Tco_0844747 [Tanacetum coccineum]